MARGRGRARDAEGRGDDGSAWLPRRAAPDGIGITTGEVVAGNVGSERRIHYAIVGDPLNTAARLQNAAGPGQILIDDATCTAVGDRVLVQDLGTLRLAGQGGLDPDVQRPRA